MRSLIVWLLALWFTTGAMAQGVIHGVVVTGPGLSADSARVSAISTGATALTDRLGRFSLDAGRTNRQITVVLKTGETQDFTLMPDSRDTHFFYFVTAQKDSMNVVKIEAERKGSEIHGRGLQKTELLNETEFKKAACCTLSESFETTNTVEVSNADGVSGIRQVEMLGLAGKYVIMTRDNIPVIRGLSVLTGLNQIPGPMVSGVHLSKGAGSVSSGNEGLTGGINYGLKSSPDDPRLFLNGYINNQLRGEANLILKSKLNKRTWNYNYLHYGGQWRTMDQGGDGFTDIPLSNRLMVGDQINYFGKKYELVAGITHVDDRREGGDVDLFHGHITHQHPRFSFSMKEQKTDAYLKFGYFLNEEATRSIGQILNVTRHSTHAVLNSLRDRKYHGDQATVYYSAIYASPDEKRWSTRSGINLMYDRVGETYTDSGRTIFDPERNEFNAGAFGELVRKTERSTWLLGVRMDYNNLYGWFLTPRLHGKIELNRKRTLHFQAGRGIRTPWIFAEYLPLLISNRNLQIEQNYRGGAYGLNREDAVNGGISYVHPFSLFGYPAHFSADVFHTHFFRQITADRDAAPDKIIISSNGGNYSQIAQADLQMMPHRRVEIRLSYRYVQSIQKLGGRYQLQPMQSPHRALGVVSFHNRKKWYFDAIFQWNSAKRLPSTLSLPAEAAMPGKSPAYLLINTQIRKDLGKKWEVYAGAENLLNVFQRNPVLSASNPDNPWFDAAFAWGPVNGINAFAGFRLKIK